MNRPHGRDSGSSGFAKAMYWGSRASSAAMQFVIPPAIGVWIDWKYSATPVGVVVGGILGFICGFRQVLQLMNQMDAAGKSSERDNFDH